MATVKLDPAKGVQIPNMTTTERNAVSSPETGALVWNTTTSAVNQYNGSAWEATDTNTQADISGKLNLSGGTMTGHIYHGDNILNYYGGGNDFHLYHDGSHTRFKNDTGNLTLQSDTINLTNRADNSSHIFCNSTGVGIGTTSPSTGLDVRGTLNVGVNDTGHDVKFHGATSGCKIFWDESADKLRVEGRADGSDIFIVTDNNKDILNIKSTGVVFNEDSGDRDFRVESDVNTQALFLEGSSGQWSMNRSKLTTFPLTIGGLASDPKCLILYGNDNQGSNPACIMEMNGRHTPTIADDSSITFSVPGTGAIFAIQQSASGTPYSGAIFHANYSVSGSTVLMSNPGGYFAASDTDGKVCCYISGYNQNVILKNRSGTSRYFSVSIIGFSGQ